MLLQYSKLIYICIYVCVNIQYIYNYVYIYIYSHNTVSIALMNTKFRKTKG